MSRWVLLRGWARAARHWGDFPARLGAQALALDLPGNGSLHRLRSPVRVAEMVEHARRAIGEVREPLHLLGMSLGGMVCVEWSSRYPQEVAACVLLNTSMRPFCRFHRRLRPGRYATLLRLIFLESDAEKQEAAILALTSLRHTGQQLAQWARFAREQPVSRANALRQLLAAARYRAPERAPAVPILVLASAADRLVDPECSASLARRWSLPLRLHPDAGHDLALDAPAWAAAEIDAWLRRS